MFGRCSKQLWSITVEGNWGQTPLNGIIGPHYADAFLILILANQFIPTHSLKYLWVYICLHTITRHKGNSSIHVSKSLDSTFGKNLITLVVYPMHNPLFYSHYWLWINQLVYWSYITFLTSTGRVPWPSQHAANKKNNN
jgi:hypothetical protein